MLALANAALGHIVFANVALANVALANVALANSALANVVAANLALENSVFAVLLLRICVQGMGTWRLDRKLRGTRESQLGKPRATYWSMHI